jgi:hypothetical protein
VGWIVTFWATPVMSAGHFVFALVMSAYILLATPLEERDLESALGEPYRRWRERTPAFVPALGRPPAAPGSRVPGSVRGWVSSSLITWGGPRRRLGR